MINILKNELFKLFVQKKIYIFMGLMFIMTLISALVFKFAEIDIIISAQSFPLEALKMNIDMLLPIFITILIADMITDEYRAGTLKLPLIHPVSRKKLLNAKILTLIIASIILLLFLLIISYILGVIMFEWGAGFTFNEITYSNVQGIWMTICSYFISVLPILAYGLIIILISLILTSSGAVVGIAIGILFAFSILIQVSEILRPYLLTYYFSFFAMLLKNPLSMEIILGLFVIGVYSTIAYIASVRLFIKKDILS